MTGDVLAVTAVTAVTGETGGDVAGMTGVTGVTSDEFAVTAVSGSGGDAVEAIADIFSIARLPPGHDPGADCGVATAARQRWHLAIRHFGFFGGPLAAAND